MTLSDFNLVPQPPCTSISLLPEDLIIEIFTYLVFDDLQDCTGVDKLFHQNVLEAMKYLMLHKKISSIYYVESRVSYKLARVRLGLNTGIKILNNHVYSNKNKNGNTPITSVLTHYPKDVTSNREIVFSMENEQYNNKKKQTTFQKSKQWNVSTTIKCHHPKILSSFPTVVTSNKKKLRKKTMKGKTRPVKLKTKHSGCNGMTTTNKIDYVRTVDIKKEVHKIENDKENYKRGPFSTCKTMASSRVHVIGKPKKALVVNKTTLNQQQTNGIHNAYRKPSPPLSTNRNLYNINGRRNVHKVIKRKKKSDTKNRSIMKHFFEMIGREIYKEWNQYKKTKGGKMKDMNQYKHEQKLKLYNSNKNVMTGFVSRQRAQQQVQARRTLKDMHINHPKSIPFR
jgi:hypothetical protein